MNVDADTVHLVHLIDFSTFVALFLTKCSEYWGHRRHSYPSFPQCVIIPFRLRIMGSQETLLPICLFQEIISIFYYYFFRKMPKRGEKETKNLQTCTFQTWKRNLIQCIPSPKISKLNWLRLEVSFGSFRISHLAWMLLAGDPLWRFHSVHPAVNNLKEWC